MVREVFRCPEEDLGAGHNPVRHVKAQYRVTSHLKGPGAAGEEGGDQESAQHGGGGRDHNHFNVGFRSIAAVARMFKTPRGGAKHETLQ